jgi:hypothetical protein
VVARVAADDRALDAVLLHELELHPGIVEMHVRVEDPGRLRGAAGQECGECRGG